MSTANTLGRASLPINLAIRTFKLTDNSQAIILGIEKTNSSHGIFIRASLRPSTVVVPIPCDSPYFIRTQQNYLKAWYYFLNGGNQPYKFFINPSPSSIGDIVMNKQKVEYWIDGPIKCTPEVFELTSNFIFSRDRVRDTQFNQNTYFVPFVSAAEGYVNSVVVGGMPLFKLIERLANTLTKSVLESAFEDVVSMQNQGMKNSADYDFEIHHSSSFLPLKIRYYNEVLKQAMSENSRVLALVDKNHLDMLAEEWEKNTKVDVSTGKPVLSDLSSIYTSPDVEIREVTEYIRKLVILDFLYENPITHYFIKFKKFPFEIKGGIEMSQLRDIETLMIVWYYHYDELMNRLKMARGEK